jgi:hypothetical protein
VRETGAAQEARVVVRLGVAVGDGIADAGVGMTVA